jgi:uncharacterized repeat protein (TIGR03837 family)
MSERTRWDIFCRIVDNYGDIGICWRLSQQLALEHKLQLRLFIDDLEIAAHIIASVDARLASQMINGVEICRWPEHAIKPASVVIETFGCGLPDAYAQQLAANHSAWINLEYLSAESWVSDFHGTPSPQPALDLSKYFFFPGFFNDSGGLIREQHLIAERNKFLSTANMQTEFWQRVLPDAFLDAARMQTWHHSIKISLFCYPQACIQCLCAGLAQSARHISLILPFNPALSTSNLILAELKAAGFRASSDNKILQLGNIHLYLIPFLSQPDYDRLLWACDLNFVRGEDSWIRAIWAGKPFVWQPYLQADAVHMNKLSAFIEVFASHAPADVQRLMQASHLAWSADAVGAGDDNAKAELSSAALWPDLIDQLPAIQAYTAERADTLAYQVDLATKLVIFSENLRNTKV